METSSECERCRTWEEEIYWKQFNSMHFFLFLPKDFHDHLVLPAKFAENMLTKLPDKVPLVGPNSTIWDIELKKTNIVDFGGEGWKEFVKVHNLKENNLLVFKYKQNLSFEVLIFDQESFCEKEASYFVKQCRHAKATHENEKKRTITEAFSTDIEDEDSEDDDRDDPEFAVSKKSKNGISGRPRRRKNPRTPRKSVFTRTPGGGGRQKKMVVPSESQNKSKEQSDDSAGEEPQDNGAIHDVVEKEPEKNGAAKEQSHVVEEQQNTTLDNGGSVVCTAHSRKSPDRIDAPKGQVPTKSLRKLMSRSAEKFSKEYKSNRRPVTQTEIDNALNMALPQIPDNGFIAVLKPSAVYKRFYLNVPATWMKENPRHRNCQVLLRVGEKAWVVYFYYSGKGWGGFTSGWKKFALENSLEEFDACLFKVATRKDDPDIVMDVEIFRVVPEIVPPSPVGR